MVDPDLTDDGEHSPELTLTVTPTAPGRSKTASSSDANSNTVEPFRRSTNADSKSTLYFCPKSLSLTTPSTHYPPTPYASHAHFGSTPTSRSELDKFQSELSEGLNSYLKEIHQPSSSDIGTRSRYGQTPPSQSPYRRQPSAVVGSGMWGNLAPDLKREGDKLCRKLEEQYQTCVGVSVDMSTLTALGEMDRRMLEEAADGCLVVCGDEKRAAPSGWSWSWPQFGRGKKDGQVDRGLPSSEAVESEDGLSGHSLAPTERAYLDPTADTRNAIQGGDNGLVLAEMKRGRSWAPKLRSFATYHGPSSKSSDIGGAPPLRRGITSETLRSGQAGGEPARASASAPVSELRMKRYIPHRDAQRTQVTRFKLDTIAHNLVHPSLGARPCTDEGRRAHARRYDGCTAYTVCPEVWDQLRSLEDVEDVVEDGEFGIGDQGGTIEGVSWWG